MFAKTISEKSKVGQCHLIRPLSSSHHEGYNIKFQFLYLHFISCRQISSLANDLRQLQTSSLALKKTVAP